MSLFYNVKPGAFINDHAHFKDFMTAFITLFRCLYVDMCTYTHAHTYLHTRVCACTHVHALSHAYMHEGLEAPKYLVCTFRLHLQVCNGRDVEWDHA